MNDRTHVEKAADAGARKVSLLQLDPCRYLLRSVSAGMGLTLVVSGADLDFPLRGFACGLPPAPAAPLTG